MSDFSDNLHETPDLKLMLIEKNTTSVFTSKLPIRHGKLTRVITQKLSYKNARLKILPEKAQN